MGNCCWPAQVNSHHSPANTTKQYNKEQSSQEGKPLAPAPVPEPEKKGKAAGENGGSGSHSEHVASIGQIITPKLRMYSFSELKMATRSFRPDTVLGEGGFGTVFKGWVDGVTHAPAKVGVGIPVAVKKSSADSEQGLKEWQAEVKFLGKFSHPNLVKLIGYCWENKEFLLVYEYMQKGSLENHLFKKGAEPLSWVTRLHIAIGAARGLEFLHTTEKSVIYRDFKASNILLDADYNAKLSDFGLAKLGPTNGDSHVSTQIVGTYGYAAPEYVATGHLYLRSDVYGFGVVLLELLTGLRVLDLERPTDEVNLVNWARPYLPEKGKLKRIIDPKLEGKYSSKGAYQVAQLIIQCIESDPKKRPAMKEVLATLEEIQNIKIKSVESKSKPKHSVPQYRTPNYRKYNNHHRSPLNYHQNGASSSNVRTPGRSYPHQSPATHSY